MFMEVMGVVGVLTTGMGILWGLCRVIGRFTQLVDTKEVQELIDNQVKEVTHNLRYTNTELRNLYHRVDKLESNKTSNSRRK